MTPVEMLDRKLDPLAVDAQAVPHVPPHAETPAERALRDLLADVVFWVPAPRRAAYVHANHYDRAVEVWRAAQREAAR